MATMPDSLLIPVAKADIGRRLDQLLLVLVGVDPGITQGILHAPGRPTKVWRGDVVRIRTHAEANQLGIDAGAPLLRVLQLFQDQHPAINLDNPDPECDLDYCANQAREMDIDVALSNSFGFGGTNGTLVLRRFR